jgi:thiamine biosynthesis lipoprotein
MTTTAAARPRTHVEKAMGTVFSFDLRDPLPSGVLGRVLDWLHWVDRTFTTYDDRSWIRRLERGEATVDDCPEEVGVVLDLCAAMEFATDGYFSVRATGRLDPSGLVKGWAIERAARMLTAAGSSRHAVGGGGDVQSVGRLSADRPWRIGVVHPLDRQQIVAVVEGEGIAVATSGTSERGRHVVDPIHDRPADALLSVTVVGPDLTRADVYATAALAMGEGAYAWLRGLPDFAALVVAADGSIWRTGDFPAAA